MTWLGIGIRDWELGPGENIIIAPVFLHPTALWSAIVLYSFVRSDGDIRMSGVVSYVVLLGGAFGLAMGLYFGFRAIKLI